MKLPSFRIPIQRTVVKSIIAALLVVVAALTGSPAFAKSDKDAVVSHIVVTDASAGVTITLSLDFDRPLSAAAAETARTSLGDDTFATMASGDPIWCGGRISRGDSNGYFDIAYQCGSTRTLPWGFQIHNNIRAIIVSNVTEIGMSWWRNGSFAGQNAPHTVPSDYLFHGTFNPVYAGNDIDYNDYMTFRHNVGSGGTGSLSIAGSVVLQN